MVSMVLYYLRKTEQNLPTKCHEGHAKRVTDMINQSSPKFQGNGENYNLQNNVEC